MRTHCCLDWFWARSTAARPSPRPSHTTETVAYLAIEGDGTLTAANEDAIITRSTYTAAGQPIAFAPARVSGHPDDNNNGLFHIHTDHLGSVSVLTYYSTGYIRGNSQAYYYPFGAYRLQPSTDVTGRRFTGQQENMEWGLYYYNARYYVPALGRFASADTIVPDPANPQSNNRYSYALNNPLKFSDPDGHCPAPPSGSGNIICVALFIPTDWALHLKGDSRGFSSDSDSSQSRAWFHIDADNGSIIQQVINPTTAIWGRVTEPLEDNWVNVVQDPESGEITLSYSLRHSGFAHDISPAIDGEIRFKRDESGRIVSSGFRDAFPNAEAYYYEDGRPAQTLFQLEANIPGFEHQIGWTNLGPLNLLGDGKFDQAWLYPDEMARIERDILSNYQALPLAGGFPRRPVFPSPLTVSPGNRGYVPY